VDAASSWAGWAVSALTSKFNRSQSQQSALGQIGQVGANGVRPKGTRYPLGHSSSSTSTTTTSSIPSTPSDVLQPTAEGQESTTDYDDDWENEDWGSIEDNKTNAKSNNSTFDTSPRRREDADTSGSVKNEGWDKWAIDEVVSVRVN